MTQSTDSQHDPLPCFWTESCRGAQSRTLQYSFPLGPCDPLVFCLTLIWKQKHKANADRMTGHS